MAHMECGTISHRAYKITIWRRFPVDHAPDDHDYWAQIVAPDGTAIVDTPWHGAEQPPTYLSEYGAEKAAKALIDCILGFAAKKGGKKKSAYMAKTQQALQELSLEALRVYPQLNAQSLDEVIAALVLGNIADDLIDRCREILEEEEEEAA